ncbi:hypothetical protein ES319_D06G065600v1 [Gossypium barbadense]|uniref:ENT domain-containing protein n=1 Tax=Gossypium barbadense TaxID=3634 RepID=A0A5J5QYJ5_GOSBA|nr:hypothetical protein ES319_D06G065600v1 [Gossypium barbadense]
MRFKKGTNVEVLSKKEVPSGSWHCAEIISGNGHNYKVRYEAYSNAVDKTIVEMVSRKAVRPCPPALVVSDNWVPGDVVEVFDNFSWKMATILAILEKKYVLVRLLGSSLEFRVSKFDIRVRQSWQDNEWVVIGKGSGSCVDVKHGENSTLRCKQNSSSQFQNTIRRTNRHVRDECGPVNTKVNYRDSVIASSKTLKRGCYSQVEAHAAAGQKLRAVERNERLYRLVAANPSVLEQKPMMLIVLRALLVVVADAESFCPRGDEGGNCLLPTKEELAALIHKIKLHAYRCTLEALHASGPLSWEQEALVTNLRLSLHISNDEHLMELRNLISSDSNIPIR